MNGRGRLSDAAVRAAERRRREDEAPRLAARVPRLASLKLEIEERRSSAVGADVSHVKRVVVDSAPALFELPCCDRSCKDGGHDVTRQILRELERGATTFDIEDVCDGSIGSAQCSRVLTLRGFATYHQPEATAL